MKVDLEPAFRRTDYVAAPLLDPPEVFALTGADRGYGAG